MTGSNTHHDDHLLLGNEALVKPDGEPLSTSQLKAVCRLSIGELQREHTDANQRSPMTFIKAFSNYSFHSLTNTYEKGMNILTSENWITAI